MACGPFSVGQGSHSADCGYFCAYVLLMNSHPPGFSPGLFSQQDVYAERDAWRQSQHLAAGHYWVTVAQLVQFLNHLGLSGYHAFTPQVTTRYPDTFAGYAQRIHDAANHSAGAILLLQRPGTSAGHYVAVLRHAGPNICCYDPARPSHSGQFDATRFAREFKDVTTHIIAHS